MQKFPLPSLLAGIAGGALFVAGVVSVIGPIADDSPSEMAATLQSGRTWTLLALFGVGMASMLGLWFMTALRGWLRDAVPDGGEALGTAMLAAATLSIGLELIGMSLFYGATYALAGQGGSQALLGLVDTANAVMMMTKFTGSMVIVEISIAMSRTSYAPNWFPSLGYFSVGALIVSSIGLFTTDSFTQFGGPLDFYGALPAGLWSLVLLVLLYRTKPLPAAVRPG